MLSRVAAKQGPMMAIMIHPFHLLMCQIIPAILANVKK